MFFSFSSKYRDIHYFQYSMGSVINFGSGKDTNAIININIKELFKNIANIPGWLKWLVCFSVIFTCLYFGYNKFFNPEIRSLDGYMKYLEASTSDQVRIEDYHKDYIQFYNEFNLVKDFLIGANATHKMEIDMIIDHLKKGDSKDQSLAIELEHVESYYQKNMEDYQKKTLVDYNIRKPNDSNVPAVGTENGNDKK